MKVILKRDIKNKGKRGDIITVADSYAKNVLIKNGDAVEATSGAMNDLKLANSNRDKVEAMAVAEANESKKMLESNEIVMSIKTGDTGKSHGHITSQKIADAINMQLGVVVDKRNIKMNAIELPGKYELQVKLHKNVIATVKLRVERGLQHG